MNQASHHRRIGLLMIGVYKLAKAAAMLIGGGVVLRLKPNDILDRVIRLATRFRFDPDDEFIHAIISRISGLSEANLESIGAGIVLYGLLFTAEGVGLLLQKRWAEYLVVVTTSLLIPLEVYEVFKKPGPLRIAVFLANVAIVVYLIRTIRIEMDRRDRQGPGSEAA